jgi:hypothetical protein
MKRTTVVRHVTLGALATSLVPLTALGAGAGQHDGSAAGICQTTFGDRGPAVGRVVGEGPSGDSMVVSVGWDPQDWPGDIGRVVTCVSVDGRAVPELAVSTVEPPNTGSLMLDLKLPAGEPGSLVCEQNVLVGKNDAPGRTRPTTPECFKLRAADPPAPTLSGGRTIGDAPAPDRGPGGGPPAGNGPAGPPAPAGRDREVTPGPAAPLGPPASAARAAAGFRPDRAPAPDPASTPPGRAACEAAGAAGTPTPRTSAPAAPARTAAAAPATPAASPVATDAAGAPAAALARTGIEHQIPLAGAGLLLALGGAAVMFGEPRRRSWA